MTQVSLGLHGDFEIYIGSDPSCRVCVIQLPARAAGLKRAGDRLFLKDYGCQPRASVNGITITRKRWVQVTRYDDLSICGFKLVLNPGLFLGRDRVDLDTDPLKLILPGNLVAVNGLYLRAKHGNLTAIMGPSGVGKTLLLNLLSGYIVPTQGKVLVNKQFDLHEDFLILRDFIGYVPQDEIMIPELTVKQSLNYRLRLRYPDMAPSVRQRLIEKTCERFGFKGARLQKFLNTIIGSAESGHRGLSGGEKRRANIAHELVLDPLILFLDEPTSGLSSVDAEQIVGLLKDLAKADGLTIIATIHQPSRDAFQLFDDLLVVSHGGKVAYYGLANQAVSHFERITNTKVAGRNPPEFIMSFLSQEKSRDHLVSSFELMVANKKAGVPGNNHIYKPVTHSSTAGSGTPSAVKAGPFKARLGFWQFLQQWLILLQRNCRVLFKDRLNLALLFGQVPLLGLLILFAFADYRSDYRQMDQFARWIYCFGQLKEPYEKENKSIPADQLLRQAVSQAQKESFLISEPGGKQRGAIYFILVAASMWFGIMGSCTEIVAEKHILKRELHSGVRITPYLVAKMAMHLTLVGVQTGLLTIMVGMMLLQLPPLSMASLWGVLWLTAATSASLGLAISCLAPTRRFALTMVPLLLIPQLLFGGLVRPLGGVGKTTWGPEVISALTLQRWGFEGSLGVDTYAKAGVLRQQLSSDDSTVSRRYEELNIVRFTNSSILRTFFRQRWEDSMTIPLGITLMYGALFFLLSYVFLKRKL